MDLSPIWDLHTAAIQTMHWMYDNRHTEHETGSRNYKAPFYCVKAWILLIWDIFSTFMSYRAVMLALKMSLVLFGWELKWEAALSVQHMKNMAYSEV